MWEMSITKYLKLKDEETKRKLINVYILLQ